MAYENIFSEIKSSDCKKFTATPDQIRNHIRKQFVDAIQDHVHDQSLTHAEAAAIAQTPRTSMTAILNGKLEKVSLDRLLNIAVRLGAPVQVRIGHPKRLEF